MSKDFPDPSCTKMSKQFLNTGHVTPSTWKIEQHNHKYGPMAKVFGGNKKFDHHNILKDLSPFQ